MRVSFTGTRYGGSRSQIVHLEQWLDQRRGQISLVAHGYCEGSDIQFHNSVVRVLGKVYIAVFPSTSRTRSKAVLDYDYMADPAPPLERNGAILKAGSDQLIAFPRLLHEELRSGTWHCIRLARKRKMAIDIMWREDGEL